MYVFTILDIIYNIIIQKKISQASNLRDKWSLQSDLNRCDHINGAGLQNPCNQPDYAIEALSKLVDETGF